MRQPGGPPPQPSAGPARGALQWPDFLQRTAGNTVHHLVAFFLQIHGIEIKQTFD
ncbi:hypothetical protein QE399_001096 [Paracidovorax wautersii]|uniref:Uncharacterized protein n=1 Tax=Paracidovorax wautersii TaxID=1177982 RepID=A0ABU1I9A6_9BURK|nr:hypothetical protein [Paracidovorax wautersii]